jgi:ankyrin repeat protein
MTRARLLDLIARGRTDLLIDLLKLPDWRDALDDGPVKALSWCVYYNDLTALRAVLAAGGDLSSIDLDQELGHAAFFGWWKIADFLMAAGANPNAAAQETGETPLHGALSKAGRPAYLHTVRVLVENGANVNARTIPGRETGAFMRDVRTKGETPLHRAAAYADAPTVAYLIGQGADVTARDAHGDSPLSWASAHLRPGAILDRLQFPPHAISAKTRDAITSDHGAGWGTGMERNQLGEYLAESRGAF